eukprot:CAMPEP_0180824724 /NCGR_PEP_ID=MMETSP1038_2-20121128/72585_1 /TAXON_ID=632150 /ORGANISM="Azadinium spinosum, Strain 3D9" /LENGTH=69 /DNA_ID=CAMNT_0022867129 /DNA_START=69 /DNA_END=275 /DNA_ORIENTATION=-
MTTWLPKAAATHQRWCPPELPVSIGAGSNPSPEHAKPCAEGRTSHKGAPADFRPEASVAPSPSARSCPS